MKDYDIEAMQEVLNDYGIEVSFEKAKDIASDFIDIYQNNREHESPVYFSNKESDFMRAERLQKELDNMKRIYNKSKNDNEIYERYIKNRLGASYVEVENGMVYFERK